jgi:hypothetical protein
MKSFLTLISLLLASPAFAGNTVEQDNYTKNYSSQLKPLVVKKLSSDRPEMTAQAVNREATQYVKKLAECQLLGLSGMPETYRDQAILPVANGASVAETTHKLNQQIRQDIADGKLSKEQAEVMLHNAQQQVQICLNQH